VLSGGSEDERPSALAAADDILVRREQRRCLRVYLLKRIIRVGSVDREESE